MARNNTKSENKAVAEKVKPVKELSPKRQIEADHLAGKHKNEGVVTCGYCQRRNARAVRRSAKR